MSTVEWVHEPTSRWLPCPAECHRAGRWLLRIMGRQVGGPVCQSCRNQMQAAWDGATGTKRGTA